MTFFRKLLGGKKDSPEPQKRPGSPAAESKEMLDARVLVSLAGLESQMDVVEYLKGGEFDTAFARLNELKAARSRSRNVDYLRAHIFVHKQQAVAAIEALKEELRYFPDNTAAAQALATLKPDNDSGPKIKDPDFEQLLVGIQPYTMVGKERLYSLFRLGREACEKDIPGNFVECGVAAGGSSALLGAVIKRYSKRPRKVFAFDTFEGMPPASEKDAHLGTPAAETGWGQGTCAAPIDSLMEVAAKLQVKEFIQPVQGLFSETLPRTKEEIGPIAFLHVDGDWYSSTMEVMTNLYDQVVSGASIQVDDYGFWEGCKKAMEDFQRERGTQFKLNPIDFTGVWFNKP